MGLNKTAEGYQEEGVIKLLKYIRDGLAGGANRPNRPNRPNDNDNNGDNNDDNNDDNIDDNNDNNNDDDRFDVALGSVFLNNLNKEISNVKSDGECYARLIAYQNAAIKKIKKELTDRKYLTKDIIDQTSKTIDKNNKERLEYYDKYKQTLFDYIKTLKQSNNIKIHMEKK